MTGKQFQSLIRRHLLPHFPESDVRRGLLFVRPLGQILRGFCFDSSGLDRFEFTVEVFVQPLFVPNEGITFSIGDRLGSICGKQERWWTLTDDNETEIMADVLKLMQREGPVILDKFTTLEDFSKNAITPHTNPYSPYPPEMVAYGAVLLGNKQLAEKMFVRLDETLHPEQEYCEYHAGIRDRAHLVRTAFERSPEDAVGILSKWREETVANLKLTKFLEPIS